MEGLLEGECRSLGQNHRRRNRGPRHESGRWRNRAQSIAGFELEDIGLHSGSITAYKYNLSRHLVLQHRKLNTMLPEEAFDFRLF